MKRITLISVALVFATLWLASCQREPAVQPVTKADKTIPSHHVPREKALAELNAFLADVDANNTTRGGKVRQIKDVIPILSDKFQNATRVSEDEAAAAIDTLLYMVNFENEEGFAILSAADFLAPIIAVMDQGNADSSMMENVAGSIWDFDDDDYCVDYDEDELIDEMNDSHIFIEEPSDSLIIGQHYTHNEITRSIGDSPTEIEQHTLRFVLRTLNDYCEYHLIDHNGSYNGEGNDGDNGNNSGNNNSDDDSNGSSNDWIILEFIPPMITTQWGQTYPYNMYCPTKNNSSKPSLQGRAPVGCVAVAVGQILTYNRFPSQIDDLTPNWDMIQTNTTNAARLLYTIGKNKFLNIDYDKYSASSNAYRVKKTLKKLGYLNVNKIAGYNENAILTCLRANKPIYIRAASPKSESYTNKRSRHGWTIDGFIKRQRLSNIEIMMHCNMGWSGSCDGYYASSIFRTTSTMDEEGNIIGENNNKYNYCKNYKIVTYDKPTSTTQ